MLDSLLVSKTLHLLHFATLFNSLECQRLFAQPSNGWPRLYLGICLKTVHLGEGRADFRDLNDVNDFDNNLTNLD